jgi:hypothetical protein
MDVNQEIKRVTRALEVLNNYIPGMGFEFVNLAENGVLTVSSTLDKFVFYNAEVGLIYQNFNVASWEFTPAKTGVKLTLKIKP